ncbi:hypothetical protein DM02DRAFT_514055 [Periconia macrospinosa]|uniref:Uncharacterized protein n=1 Tax=Periconia macrospinosa TaxID=97972 RepID=A0A2V1E8N2_9PLEO|nr:hypothetical protein DM02DRAFT_514055 [Periconia macrospinosa]
MCNVFIRTYQCGHSSRDKAPCAQSKTAPCGDEKVRKIKHEEKCDNCERQ